MLVLMHNVLLRMSKSLLEMNLRMAVQSSTHSCTIKCVNSEGIMCVEVTLPTFVHRSQVSSQFPFLDFTYYDIIISAPCGDGTMGELLFKSNYYSYTYFKLKPNYF